MKRQGFTLVELLAVIVILAIIALITRPIISDEIEKARKSAANSSAIGYINTVEKQVLENDLSAQNIIKDGVYGVSELDIDYKGKAPSPGIVTIEKKKIKSAKLCINGYSFNYDGEKVGVSDNNYCNDNFKIVLKKADGTEQSENIGTIPTKTYALNEIGVDTTITNISCNNSANVKVANNELVIKNIFGDITCQISDSLETTINNLDNTETNIVMLNNETLTNYLTIKKDKNITLDLNGKTVSSSTILFSNVGNLKILSSNNQGTLSSGASVISSNEDSKTIIDGIKIISTNQDNTSTICNKGYVEINGDAYIEGIYGVGCNSSNTAAVVINDGTIKANVGVNLNSGYTNKLIVNDGYIYGNAASIRNYGSGSAQINGGIFISETNSAILSSGTATMNINQSKNPIYISSLIKEWKPAIFNYSTNNLNITANSANECTSDYTQTTSGLCVYAYTGNGTVQNNNSGNININGGTYVSGAQGINNGSTGIANIINVEIISEGTGILNNNSGTMNICNSKINSSLRDIYNSTAGTVNYSRNVIFTDGTNTPVIGGSSVNINPNYSGTCLES